MFTISKFKADLQLKNLTITDEQSPKNKFKSCTQLYKNKLNNFIL